MAENFALFGRDLFGVPIKPAVSGGVLAKRFTFPPFSVLDARSGAWQERKRAWLSLGIESELGRVQVPGSGNHRTDYGGYLPNFKAAGAEPLEYRELHIGGSRLASDGSSASIFDPVLCELAYRWFCPERGHVLDPFAGGSVRGIVAVLTGREYTGVDLSERQIAANRVQGEHLCGGHRPNWIAGDSTGIGTLTRNAEADFLFSCPPYADLEVYSDHPADISAMPWHKFLDAYHEIIRQAAAQLRQRRFACFVVGDVRDDAGVYRNLPGETIQAFTLAGLELYNEAILVTPAGTLPIRSAIPFVASRKLGKSRQNVLVFVKGDPRKAAEACSVIDEDRENTAALADTARTETAA